VRACVIMQYTDEASEQAPAEDLESPYSSA
jgi:hypothetical protein